LEKSQSDLPVFSLFGHCGCGDGGTAARAAMVLRPASVGNEGASVKVRVRTNGTGGSKPITSHGVTVELGDKDVTEFCRDVHVNCELDSLVTVNLEMIPTEQLDVDVDAMVYLSVHVPPGYELVQEEPVNGLRRTYIRRVG
jgi:hypothetical protein